jgi:hypothetical protein
VALSRSHSSLYSTDSDIDAVSQQRAAARPVLRRSGSQGHLGVEEICQRTLIPSLEPISNIQGQVKVFDNWLKPFLSA